MIQKGTYFNVVDNSGGKKAYCMHVYGGYRKRYAKIGDVVVVSLQSIKSKENIKIKKGDVVKALIVRTKETKKNFADQIVSFFDNSVVLLNNQNKLLGTRIFIPVLRSFRATRFLRIISLASGLIK